MQQTWVLVGVGIAVGIYSGIMGLGGGTIMIPIMILALGFTQHQAVATSLAAMIPPVTLPAVIHYYREGHVDLGVAFGIAVGIAAGAFLGGLIGGRLPEYAMKLIFGFTLIYVAGYIIFQSLGKEYLVRSMLLAAVLVAVTGTFFLVTRWYDGRQSVPPIRQAQPEPSALPAENGRRP